MMINLDTGLLENHLALTLTKIEQSGYHSFLPVFRTLYDHGFRVNELASCHEWSFLNQNQIIAKTSKGSQDRFLNVEDVEPEIITSIQTGTNVLFKMSYPTYERAFILHSPALRYLVKTKKIGTHLFRHHRIKAWSNQGLSISQIRAISGIKTDHVVQGYIDSEIMAEVI